MVKEVGFNTVWTHDKPYDGTMKLEDTLMYRHMKTPGVKYIIAKIERGIWGWTFDQAMRHAAWIAELSLTHKEIIGLYLNDFYEETEKTARGRPFRRRIPPDHRQGQGDQSRVWRSGPPATRPPTWTSRTTSTSTPSSSASTTSDTAAELRSSCSTAS